LSQYVKTGHKAAKEFIETCILLSKVKFGVKMKKLSLKTFQAMAAKCTLTAKNKTVQVKAERNFLGSLLLLSQQHDVSLEHIFHLQRLHGLLQLLTEHW